MLEARAIRAALAAAWLGVALPSGAETVRVVKDVDPRADADFGYVSGISRFLALGDRVVFTGRVNDGVSEAKLWGSDGTADGTIPLGPHPQGLTAVGRVALFRTAYDGARLWRTDGTPEGTALVKELPITYSWCSPDQAGSSCQDVVAVGDIAFFAGWSQFTSGTELWRTDGTPTGTFLVRRFSMVSSPVAFRGRLYVWASGLSGDPIGLYSSDGTSLGTRLVKRGVFLWLSPVVAAGKLFFASERDVWVSDGSPRGTVRLTRFAENDREFYPWLASSERAAFFGVRAPSGHELWTSDGTSAGTRAILGGEALLDGRYGPGSAALNGRLFFLSRVESECRLWQSDGTPAGTQVLKDLGPGYCLSPLETAAGRLFITLYRLGHEAPSELWVSDGTEDGTRQVATFPLSEYSAGGMTRLGPWLLFGAPHEDSFVSEAPLLLAIPAPVDASARDTRASRGTCDATADFRVSLSGPSEQTITVDYATADDSAQAGHHYDNTRGTLTLPPGSTSGLVRVPLICEGVAWRAGRTFFLDISSPTNASLARSRATATLGPSGPRVTAAR